MTRATKGPRAGLTQTQAAAAQLVRRQQRSAAVVSHRAVGPFRLYRNHAERKQFRDIVGDDTPARQRLQTTKLEEPVR